MLGGIGAGYEEGLQLKNVTTLLLSDTIQKSLARFGLVPTYQNASVSPFLVSHWIAHAAQSLVLEHA